MVIKIDYEKCCWKDGRCTSCSCNGTCNGCVEACPKSAIEKGKTVRINAEKCNECGLCISACKHGAISLI